MAIILISGGSGLIGRALSKRLIELGHEVRILSRNPKTNSSVKSFFWNIDTKQIDEAAFENIDHLVHLAGEGIAEKSWTKERKQQIIDSRVESMKLLETVLVKRSIKLKSFVGASAIGYYGMQTSETIFSETDPGTDDFLSHTCQLWENAYSQAPIFAERSCIVRTGIVLSEKGGALGKMGVVFKLGIGSPIGPGKQYMPWIHLDDLIGVYTECLFNSKFEGVYNAVSSEHIDNYHFSKALAKAYRRPFFMPKVPSKVLRLLYGEMAKMLLTGSRISNQKLLATGFVFKYSKLDIALSQLS